MFLQRYVFVLKSPTIPLNILILIKGVRDLEIEKCFFLKNNCDFYGFKEKKQYFCG